MKRYLKVTMLACIVMVLTMQIPAQAQTFPDVAYGAWYKPYVDKCSEVGIINGFEDGTFRADDNVTRAQFIKMVCYVTQVWSDHAPTINHWASIYWDALNDAGIFDVHKTTGSGSNIHEYTEPLFPCTVASLDKQITRYEMAYILNNTLFLSGKFDENTMELRDRNDSYANHIADYNSMDKSYRSAVEQVYSKGILCGFEDTSFRGYEPLSRGQAAKVITTFAWPNMRKAQTFAVERKFQTVDPSQSFAFRYRNMSNWDRRFALFGDGNKTHFSSLSDAGSHIVPVEVPIWRLNKSTGAKTSDTVTLYVNRIVKDEVYGIMSTIYNDPEIFPIKDIHCARFSDTMRHSWGAAIDINYNDNYYHVYNTNIYVGDPAKYKPGVNPYSIGPNSSVVKAFAKYGWGWGGQGWTSAVDHMHFSILASGG